MNTEKWKYLQQQFESTSIPGVTPLLNAGATGPMGPPGPTPTGEQYSDYLFWNINGASWAVGSSAVHIGCGAGLSNQATCAIAVGMDAGRVNQGDDAVAVGTRAGYQNQGLNSVAVGKQAGNNQQQATAVAIGVQAGYMNQGTYAIALGYKAGYQNQQEKSIVLNAWDTALNGTTAGCFYVRPVRDASGSAPTATLFYDTNTSEVVYAPSSQAPNTVKSVTKSALISYTDNVATTGSRFVTNGTGTAVVTSVSQRVVLHVNVQLVLNCAGPCSVAFTVGRGVTASLSASYINLANNLRLDVTPLAVADNAANAAALLTSFSQLRSDGVGDRVLSVSFIVTDAPGAGTWYYALQAHTSEAATLTVRNTHIIITVMNQ